jgi:hypothetical protein
MELDIVKIADVIGGLGATSLLALAIIGGFKGWYVWRWTYDDRIKALIAERDEWKAIARQGLKLSSAVIQTGTSGPP